MSQCQFSILHRCGNFNNTVCIQIQKFKSQVQHKAKYSQVPFKSTSQAKIYTTSYSKINNFYGEDTFLSCFQKQNTNQNQLYAKKPIKNKAGNVQILLRKCFDYCSNISLHYHRFYHNGKYLKSALSDKCCKKLEGKNCKKSEKLSS